MRLDLANITKFRLARTTTPSSPAAGYVYFYVKDSDGKAYVKNSSGTETIVGDTPNPKHVVIPVWAPDANTNWSSLLTTGIGTPYVLSTGAVDADIEFDVTLADGTYTLYFLTFNDTNRGKFHLYIDDVATGTPVDTYGTAGAVQVGSFASLSLSGDVNIRFKMETKHASSSAYYGVLAHLWLKKTG